MAEGRVLVTGANGFLGQRIVAMLAKGGFSTIRTFDLKTWDDRTAYEREPQPRDLNPAVAISSLCGDIREYDQVRAAVDGCTMVFHAAAVVDWGQRPYEFLKAVNYGGAMNVLRACQELGVRRLVLTSTMDTVIPLAENMYEVADEDLSYPDRFMYGNYAKTKCAAERAVLAANDGSSLVTAAIRPTNLWGPRDPHAVPNTLTAACNGDLSFRIGSPDLRYQQTYVDNTAWAHVLLARRMLEAPSVVGGQAYIIVDDRGLNFWDHMNIFVEACGFEMGKRHIPVWLAMLVAHLTVLLAFLISPFVKWQPLLTPESIRGICYNQTFQGNKARADLGFEPVVTPEEGLERAIPYFQAWAAKTLHKKA